MFDHAEINTRSLGEVTAFYEDILKPLGFAREPAAACVALSTRDRCALFIVEGTPEPVHLAFRAPDRDAVHEVREIAHSKRHPIDVEPRAIERIHPRYYALSLRDPDGRLIEIVSHT